MSEHSGSRAGLRVDGEGVGTVAHAGSVLLLEAARVVGLDRRWVVAHAPPESPAGRSGIGTWARRLTRTYVVHTLALSDEELTCPASTH